MLMTVCYIEKDDEILMLHRTKKENDINKGKWIGVGGKVEFGETPFDCIVREIKEETGLIANKIIERGKVVYYYNGKNPDEMYLYTCDDFSGNIVKECSEGDLMWIKKENLLDLNLWEADKIFYKFILDKSPYFFAEFNYDGEKLIDQKIQFYNE